MNNQISPWDLRWEEVQPLSKGGQGHTVLVRHKSTLQTGVLKKLINPKNSQARRRMFQEISSLTLLRKTQCKIPTILDENSHELDNEDVELFFVMEFIEGEDLTALIKRKTLSLDEAGLLILALNDTLKIALDEGIIHRDLKPGNLMVRSVTPPDIFILDFGLSYWQKQDENVTRIGETLDNKFLSLPERRVRGGDRRDIRSEITSLVGLLYFCLTAVPPTDLVDHEGHPPHNRLNQKPSDFLEADSRLPLLTSLFDKGFSPRIDDRFQTLEDFRERLVHALTRPSTENIESFADFIANSRKEMREKDRITQLQEFRQRAIEVTSSINRVFIAHEKNITPFKLQRTGISGGNFSTLPGVGHTDLGSQAMVTLGITGHAEEILLYYQAFAKDLEVGVFRRVMHKTPNGQGWIQLEEWLPIYWFNGFTAPNTTLVEADVKASLIRLFKKLKSIAIGN